MIQFLDRKEIEYQYLVITFQKQEHLDRSIRYLASSYFLAQLIILQYYASMLHKQQPSL